MVQINWTIQAKNDLKSIAEYISRDSVFYAKLTVLKIQKRTSVLKTNKFSGKIVQELPHLSFRELIEGNYRIIYKIVSESRIDIITIHHSARNFATRKF